MGRGQWSERGLAGRVEVWMRGGVSCLVGVAGRGEIQVLTSVGAQRRLARKEPLPAWDATVTASCEAGLFAAILMYL